jgi:choline-phosphate cytidylyltransferase
MLLREYWCGVMPCNFMVNVYYREMHRSKTYRIYADGVFDLFHYGHMRYLKKAKSLFANVILIVGICSDEDTIIYKRKPIMSHRERIECVRHCKYVDEVIEHAPWILTDEFIDSNNIDFVVSNGTPYPCGNIDDVYEFLQKQNKLMSIPRTEEISTSSIIKRVMSFRNDN